MAFNPFRGFRKHKKVFFAGLTILCMVTFVMCSGSSMLGKGDFFEPVLAAFGGGRQRATIIATLYGNDVHAQEIRDVRNQRRLANQYVENITMLARNEVINTVAEASRKWEDNQKFTVGFILQTRFRDFSRYVQGFKGIDNLLLRLESEFAQAKKTAEASQVGDLRRALEEEYRELGRPRNQLYFGGTMSLEDILDFMLWRHEADVRGIQLTRQDVNELMQREVGNRVVPKTEVRKLEQAMAESHRNNFNVDTFRTALADEFRVRIAKTALMGDDQGDSPGVASATPYEFWQFYRENRTENTVAVLPIPVRNKDFLNQVGQPSEKDLQDLFEKHKDQEYIAGADQPGFKVPARITVEWVNAQADSEHYRQQAARTAALTQAGLQILAGSQGTLSGSIASEATQAGLPLAFDWALLREYDFEKYRLRNPAWTDLWEYNSRLHDSSVRRAENVAAAVGQAVGSAFTQAPVLSGVMTFEGAAAGREIRDRALYGVTMVAAAGANPLLPAAAAWNGSARPEFIPLTDVKDQLAEKVETELAQKLVQTDLGELENELKKLHEQTPEKLQMSQAVNRPELIAAALGQALGGMGTGAPVALTAPIPFGPPAMSHYVQARAREALVTAFAGLNPYPLLASSVAPIEKSRKTIDQAIARHNWQHGSTTKPEDRFTIADDPGLKPLKDAYVRNPFGERQGKDFANLFFRNLRGEYTPQQYPQGDSTNPFLYWKTNDLPPYVPTFEEVKEKVKDWWQFDKARELAKKEAEDLKTKAQGQTDAERWLKDGTKHSEPMFSLENVAGLVKDFTPTADFRANTYRPYEIPKDKIEYPPDDLVKDLLALRDVGQVIVRSDRPKAIYYVMALTKRSEPSEFALYREYMSGADTLFAQMDNETKARQEYREGLLNQLRQDAHLTIKDENREQVDEKNRSE